MKNKLRKLIGWVTARICNYCGKKVTCPCETLKNSQKCSNNR